MDLWTKLSLTSLVSAVILAGCSNPPPPPPPIAPQLESRGFTATPDGERCTFRRGLNTLTVTGGSRVAVINGSNVYLFHPVTRDETGVFQFTPENLNQILLPLLNPPEKLARPIHRILIDPGHGGSESGARGRKFLEKDLNLSLAKLIRDELVQRGFEVEMTREDDRDVSLNRRGDLTRERNADLFLSVHHNSAGSAATGMESYCLTPHGLESTNSNGGGPTEQKIYANRFDHANLLLTHLIQKRISPAAGGPDRCTKFARFRVLVRANCPATLMEAGFISNPAEELEIGSLERQRRVALATAEAIEEFAAATAPAPVD